MAEKEKKTPAAETPSTQEAGKDHVQAGDFDEVGQHLSRELARQLEHFLARELERFFGGWEERIVRILDGWEERIEARLRILDEARAEATLSHRGDALPAPDFPVVVAEAPVSPDDKVRYRVKVLCKREKGFYRANRFWPGGTWTEAEVHDDDLDKLQCEPLLTVEVLHSTD